MIQFFVNLWKAQRNARDIALLLGNLKEVRDQNKRILEDRNRISEKLVAAQNDLARFHTTRGANGKFAKKETGQ